MQKKVLIWIVVAIAAVLIGATAINEYGKSRNSNNIAVNYPTIKQPTPAAVANPSPTPAAAAKTPTPTAAARLSYGAALNTYKNRMQLLSCHGTPGTLVVGKSSPVMFDNRDHAAHLIKVGAQSVSVPGLDYGLLYPNTKGSIQVTCDGGGAGLLQVE